MDKIKTVLVIGLGRIGLPQALVFSHFGHKVFGFDKNKAMLLNLKKGTLPFFEPNMQTILEDNLLKNFFPISSEHELMTALQDIDAVVFTIGTSPPEEQDVLNNVAYDLSKYHKLLDMLFNGTQKPKKGIKLIIRTTLPLGGTDQLRAYLEHKKSLKEGVDFFLAFVPERIIEGDAIQELMKLPKIVGVYKEAAFLPIKRLFQNLGGKTIRVKDPKTAEFCKLTDNAFRSTMFGFANEIAMHANDCEIDAEEVIRAVNFNYQRNHIPRPGFVSGYCLSKDPYLFEFGFLNKKPLRQFHSLWFYGRKTNEYLIEYAVMKTLDFLKSTTHPTLAVLGLSFKENVDDFRLSHTLKILEKLVAHKIKKLRVFDPYLDDNAYAKLDPAFEAAIEQKTKKLTASFFEDVDAILLCVPHDILHHLNHPHMLKTLLKKVHNPCFIFDGWDVWTEARHLPQITYLGVGIHDEKNKGTPSS